MNWDHELLGIWRWHNRNIDFLGKSIQDIKISFFSCKAFFGRKFHIHLICGVWWIQLFPQKNFQNPSKDLDQSLYADYI
jgi:hypothetical protein